MKHIFSLLLLSTVCGFASAQTLTVKDVEVKPGDTAAITLVANAGGGEYQALQGELKFSTDKLSVIGSTTQDGSWGDKSNFQYSKENRKIAVISITDPPMAMPQGDETLGTIEFAAAADIELGEYTGTISGIEFLFYDNDNNVSSKKLDDVTFKIKVVNVYTVELDENSTTAPEAANGVNVVVKRTINANEWSTICLPFKMTEDQVKAAFGSDVQIGDFTGCETTEDADENTIGIAVKFQKETYIDANHPYIIKVSKNITEFTAKDIVISVEEVEPSVDMDEYTTGKGKTKQTFYNRFVGTYTAETEVPSQSMFLSGNKFYYSSGSTKMKAFRGYFDFYEVLTAVADQLDPEEARFSIVFGDDATGIRQLSTVSDGNYYDLQGRRVGQPTKKGLYIKNGKKEYVK